MLSKVNSWRKETLKYTSAKLWWNAYLRVMRGQSTGGVLEFHFIAGSKCDY